MYIKFHPGTKVKKGRCFGYYQCTDFKLFSLYFFHIRICPSKKVFDSLPQAG